MKRQGWWLFLALALPVGAEETAKSNLVAGAKEPTVVTAERMQADYLHNLGTLEGNVLVVDPRITVRADKMVVFYAGREDTNALRGVQRIVAEGGVVIMQAERKATSEHAEYVATDGKVVLTGSPVLTGREGTVSGTKITFWRDTEKMEVEASSRLVIYPEEQRRKSAEEGTSAP